MMRLDLLTFGRLSETRPGELFVSLDEDRAHFLAGALHDREVAIALGNDRPFAMRRNGQWATQYGYTIAVQLEVDEDSAVLRHSEHDCRLGEIVRHRGGWGICAHDGDDERLVQLGGEIQAQSPAAALMCFRRWQMVMKADGSEQLLYRFDGERLAGDGLTGTAV